MSKTLREALADLLEARATLACMAQPQLVALDRAVQRIEAALAAQAQAEPVAHVSSIESGSPLMCGLSEWERRSLVALYAAPQPAAQPVAEDPPQWLPPSLFGAWDRMQGQRVEAQAQPVAVPDGWAGTIQHVIAELESLDDDTAQAQCETLRAMLAAAPKVQP